MSTLGVHVPGYGPRDAEIMFVGEAPGYVEETRRRPFVGKTGQEMERLCRQAGINWNHTYRTNLVKFRPQTQARTGNVKPTAADIKRDEWELIDELETVRPQWVVVVGSVASRWMLGSGVYDSMEVVHGFCYKTENWRARESVVASTGKVGMEVRRSENAADRERANHVYVATSHNGHRNAGRKGERDGDAARADSGTVRGVEVLSGGVHSFITIPVYHPASGLHQPENQPLIYHDFMMVGRYVRGELPLTRPVDEHPDPDYYEPQTGLTLMKSLPVAVDTEGLRGRVWGLSFSQIEGSAGVVRKVDRKMIAKMKQQLLEG